MPTLASGMIAGCNDARRRNVTSRSGRGAGVALRLAKGNKNLSRRCVRWTVRLFGWLRPRASRG